MPAIGRKRKPLLSFFSYQWALFERFSISLICCSNNGSEIFMSIASSRCRRLFKKMLRNHQIQYTLSYEINIYETVKKWVMHGLGLTLLPKTIVTTETQNGQLAILPLDYPNFKLNVQLCYHAKRQLSIPMKAFIQLLCRTTPHGLLSPEQANTALQL